MAEVSAPHGPPERVRRPNNSEHLRPGPWTYRLPRWQAEAAVIPEGGTSHVRHGTAGVRGPARRRGGCVADGGTVAAGGNACDWLSEQLGTRCFRSIRCCIPPWPFRNGPRRGSERLDRIPLDNGQL